MLAESHMLCHFRSLNPGLKLLKSGDLGILHIKDNIYTKGTGTTFFLVIFSKEIKIIYISSVMSWGKITKNMEDKHILTFLNTFIMWYMYERQNGSYSQKSTFLSIV